MATSNKGPGSRTQSWTKRGLTRADIARLKKIRDKPSPKGTTMAKTDKFMKRRKALAGLKAVAKKHGSKIGKAVGSAVLGTLGTFGPAKKLRMAVKGVKLAGKGAKTAAAAYVKLKTKIAKLKKGETLSQVLKRKNKLSGVYGGKAAVVGGAAAAGAGAAAVGKIKRDLKKNNKITPKYIRDLKKNKRTPMAKIEAAEELARSRKPSGRINKDDINNAKEAMKLYGVKKARDRKPSGRLTSDDIKRAMKKASPGGGRSRRS
jgi:hypothetical protein